MTVFAFGPSKIVSGAQTGVDRAALDVALELGIPCGGWVPKGRRAEDGPVSARYPVVETDDEAYRTRTRLNVRDSDATLIVCRGAPTGGTRFTANIACDLGRPLLVVDLEQSFDPATAGAWLADIRPATLNIAGPRESTAPGIYAEARDLLARLLAVPDPREPGQSGS